MGDLSLDSKPDNNDHKFTSVHSSSLENSGVISLDENYGDSNNNVDISNGDKNLNINSGGDNVLVKNSEVCIQDYFEVPFEDTIHDSAYSFVNNNNDNSSNNFSSVSECKFNENSNTYFPISITVEVPELELEKLKLKENKEEKEKEKEKENDFIFYDSTMEDPAFNMDVDVLNI
jgi:hypothetical protein